MKSSMKKVVLGSATLAAAGAAGQIANAATDNITINARILDPVGITQTLTMNFGSLTETGAGTAVLGFTDNITPSGTITAIGSNAQTGGFKVAGSTGVNIVISQDGSATLTSGANTMNVTNIQVQNPLNTITGQTITVQLAANPSANFDVGGTLNIGAGQAAGVYTGTQTITALYQ